MRGPALVAITIGLLLGSTAAASAAAPPRTVRLISGGNDSSPWRPRPSAVGISATAVGPCSRRTPRLVPSDVNGTIDIYARDSDGTIQLISTATERVPGVRRHERERRSRLVHDQPPRPAAADVDASAADIYEMRRDGPGGRSARAGRSSCRARSSMHPTMATMCCSTPSRRSPAPAIADAGNDLYDRRADGSVRLVTPNTLLNVGTNPNSHVLTADGTRLTIVTNEGLVASDNDAQIDSYSVPTAGGLYTLVTPGTRRLTSAVINRAGTRTWFTTTTRLVAADTDTAADVYERRADGTIHLVSGGTANTPATLVGGLEDGSSVIFSTAEGLLATDSDSPASICTSAAAMLPCASCRAARRRPRAVFMGENADGSVVFQSDDNLADTDVA